MRQHSIEEKKIIANFFSNIGVAWFVVSVVSPLFTPARRLSEAYGGIALGIFLAYVFLKIAVLLVGEKR